MDDEIQNLMWWAIFLKRKLKKKSPVVENLNLLKPIVSVLRQSAGFFFEIPNKGIKNKLLISNHLSSSDDSNQLAVYVKNHTPALTGE